MSEDVAAPQPAEQRFCFICKPEDRLASAQLAECLICGKSMCDRHASKDDPLVCCICLNPSKATIKEEPLKDVEGVTHEGRVLHLVGDGWITTSGRIATMTDDELRTMAEQYRMLVRESEQTTDHRRVKLTMIEMELSDRDRARSKSRKKKDVATGDLPRVTQVGTATVRSPAKKPLAPLTKEQVAAQAQALAALLKEKPELMQQLLNMKKNGGN